MKIILLALGVLIMSTQISQAAEAYFGGGCFWCMEAAYQELPEVTDAISGYTDDGVEIVKVVYSPEKISYEKLVEIYWQNIDPFDKNGQFFDRGHKYQTAIYVANDAERAIAEASKVKMDTEFGQVTAVKILPVAGFKKADDGHQDYYKKNETQYLRYKKGSGREDFLKKIWEK